MQIVTASEIKARLDAGEKLNLLDVREEDERAGLHIGGVHIPLGDLINYQTDAIDDLKDEEIIVYCRSGQRSMQACMILEQCGFANVKNLAGGVKGWAE